MSSKLAKALKEEELLPFLKSSPIYHQDNLNYEACQDETNGAQNWGLHLCSSPAAKTSVTKKMTSPPRKQGKEGSTRPYLNCSQGMFPIFLKTLWALKISRTKVLKRHLPLYFRMLETIFKITLVKRVEGQNNVSSKAEKAGRRHAHVHSRSGSLVAQW